MQYLSQQTEKRTADGPIDPDGRQWFNELVWERLGERRFYALAAAIREHETRARSRSSEPADHDLALYARLRLICGEL